MIRLTRQQAGEIDRRAVERYRIPSIVLMENAARSALRVAEEMLEGDDGQGPVTILCGGGNNGGDGLALARHLHLRGVLVEIALMTDPSKYKGDALTNWQIVQVMGIQTGPVDVPRLRDTSARLMVDAIFGTGLSQPPRDPFGDIVAAVAANGAPILSLDLPSGLDCDTGIPFSVAIKADRTITFAAEKAGFAHAESRRYTGLVIVGDIGCPVE